MLNDDDMVVAAAQHIVEKFHKRMMGCVSDKNDEAWCIYIDGQRFTTPKGKSAWKARGHAKLALRNQYHNGYMGYHKREILRNLGIPRELHWKAVEQAFVTYCDVHVEFRRMT